MMGFSDEVCLLQPGMTIGDLQVLAFLGKGTVGEVYEAVHEPSGENVALKIVPRAMEEEAGDNLFLRESSRLKRLRNHPNIAAPDDMGHEDMLFWFRLPMFAPQTSPEGASVKTLSDFIRVRGGALTPHETTFYLYQILEALAFAHSKEVVHENLKADNIFFASDGIKVGDFALTRLVGRGWDDFHLPDGSEVTEPSSNLDDVSVFSKSIPAMLASFDLWPPERRTSAELTPASDVYSAGLLALNILTGRHRLGGWSVTDASEEIDPLWDSWLMRALAWRPEDRFANAQEMLDTLPGVESLSVIETEETTAEADAEAVPEISSFAAVEDEEVPAAEELADDLEQPKLESQPEPSALQTKESQTSQDPAKVPAAPEVPRENAGEEVSPESAMDPANEAAAAATDEKRGSTENAETSDPESKRSEADGSDADEAILETPAQEGSPSGRSRRFRVVAGSAVLKIRR